jgi:hypothetical protein
MPRGVRFSDAEAAAIMRSAGADPQEPYPGAALPWRCTCRSCGGECAPRLNSVRSGAGPCWACGRAQAGNRRAITPEDAEIELRSYGLEPEHAFPGTVSEPWQARCTSCGRSRAVRLRELRRGQPACRPCRLREGRSHA